MKKRALALLLAALMVLGCTACGDSTASSAAATSDATAAAASGTETDTTTAAASGSNYLNIMSEVEVESLDPQVATDGTSFEVIADYTDGLMQMDAEGGAIPAIAESYEVSEDGTTYTFHLREDAYWSNGDPVTADDFVFGWQRAVDPAIASEYSYMLSDIGQVVNAAEIINGEKSVEELGITAVDDKTLEVQLNVPVSYFLSLMYFPTFYPMNRAFYESLDEGTYGTSPETVLSNGAFILESFEPAALSFSLKKNPDYYDADSVSLDGLNYQVIKDSQQALLSYQAGDLDIMKLSGDQVEQVEDDPNFSVHGAGYLWYLTMNSNDVECLNNVNFRMAISNALDRVSIVDDVVKDGSVATYTAVPPQFATGPDGSDFSEDQTMFAEYCSDDAEFALECYNKACEELGQTEFTLELLVEDQTETQNVAAVIKEQLESALPGLTINLKVEPKKQRVADIQDGNYEVCLTRWGPDYADPMTYLNMWTTGCSNNYGLWSNSDYDAIIEECTTGDLCTDAEGRWSALYDAEQIIMENAVIAPVYTKAEACMTASNVSGIEFHPCALNRVFKHATKE
jgi:oligopeptide transport system substrate-binding protein